MKGRESGMPEEGYWQSFFDADCIIEKLECTIVDGPEIKFGMPLFKESQLVRF